MIKNIYLVDTNTKLCEEWKKYKFPPNFKIINNSLNEILTEHELYYSRLSLYVCPGDVLGSTNTGIRKYYSELFENFSSNLKIRINKLNYKIPEFHEKKTSNTALDMIGLLPENKPGHQSILPIGSSILVPCDFPRNKSSNYQKYIIYTSVTEYEKDNISGSKNVFYCYKSVFDLIRNMNLDIENLYITGIGTGLGGVSAEQCASDLYNAYNNIHVCNEYLPNQNAILNTKLTESNLTYYDILWKIRKNEDG